MSAASARLRREGPSVHHALCDLRRFPMMGPPKCTCLVPDVAAAVADLLDEIHRPLDEREKYEDRLGVIHGKALAVEAAITRGAS